MADKLSKGSNSSTLKNLSVEIGNAGQSYGNTKNCNIDDNKNKTNKKKKKKKKKEEKKKKKKHEKKHTHTHYQITFEKKVLR